MVHLPGHVVLSEVPATSGASTLTAYEQSGPLGHSWDLWIEHKGLRWVTTPGPWVGRRPGGVDTSPDPSLRPKGACDVEVPSEAVTRTAAAALATPPRSRSLAGGAGPDLPSP